MSRKFIPSWHQAWYKPMIQRRDSRPWSLYLAFVLIFVGFLTAGVGFGSDRTAWGLTGLWTAYIGWVLLRRKM